MRDKDKKQVILDFLKHMETKDIHLTLYGKFKDNSMWSKDNPQPSHRTMINIQFKVDRLNENDKDVEIDKWLLNNWFVDWNWALEKHPEPEFQPVSMELV